MKTKQAQAARITELERKLQEALAGQAFVYHIADSGVQNASTNRMMASGVVITLHALGGREIIPTTVILDGLSDATIVALRADFARSYLRATEMKPKGA